jgi:hypothetical protein
MTCVISTFFAARLSESSETHINTVPSAEEEAVTCHSAAFFAIPDQCVMVTTVLHHVFNLSQCRLHRDKDLLTKDNNCEKLKTNRILYLCISSSLTTDGIYLCLAITQSSVVLATYH